MESPIPTRTLGRTGLAVSSLGYGSMGLRGPRTWGVRVVDDSTAECILHQVLDVGINFIDTSPDYGVSETRIGRFLSSRRGEFLLATKCGCCPVQHPDHLEIAHQWSRDVVARNVETSLQNLQSDHIDLLQFHGGTREAIERAELVELLKDYQSSGMIGWIGVSTSLPNASAFVSADWVDVIQVPYSCLAPEHDAIMATATASNIGVIVRGGIAQGGPDAEIQREGLNSIWQQARLDELLEPGMSRSDLILRYTLSNPACSTTIVGTCHLEHLQQNVAAAKEGSLCSELCDEIATRVRQTLSQGSGIGK